MFAIGTRTHGVPHDQAAEVKGLVAGEQVSAIACERSVNAFLLVSDHDRHCRDLLASAVLRQGALLFRAVASS
jgi:hypothetical protein